MVDFSPGDGSTHRKYLTSLEPQLPLDSLEQDTVGHTPSPRQRNTAGVITMMSAWLNSLLVV